MIFATLNWYARDENPLWREWVDLLAKGFRNTAIRVEDRAYYPMQSSIKPDGSWHFMLGVGELPIPYTPPDEPSSDQQGLEGGAKSGQARHLSARTAIRLTGKNYSVSFRGSTVEDIEPRDSEHTSYPLYRVESFQLKRAPLRKTKRFMAEKLIPLGTY